MLVYSSTSVRLWLFLYPPIFVFAFIIPKLPSEAHKLTLGSLELRCRCPELQHRGAPPPSPVVRRDKRAMLPPDRAI